ncbi:hypothetical protein HK098_008363, partial [Nowakowskiella sp. JEL0407]
MYVSIDAPNPPKSLAPFFTKSHPIIDLHSQIVLSDEIPPIKSLANTITKKTASLKKSTILVIDSISSLLLHYSISSVIQFIKYLSSLSSSNNNSSADTNTISISLLLVFHKDMYTVSETDHAYLSIYETLNTLSRCSISFSPLSESESSNDLNLVSYKVAVNLLIAKRSTVTKEFFGAELLPTGLKFFELDISPVLPKSVASSTAALKPDPVKSNITQPNENEVVVHKKKNKKVEDDDPTANLSFNLRLTDEQRAAKDNMVLPFMEAQIFN